MTKQIAAILVGVGLVLAVGRVAPGISNGTSRMQASGPARPAALARSGALHRLVQGGAEGAGQDLLADPAEAQETFAGELESAQHKLELELRRAQEQLATTFAGIEQRVAFWLGEHLARLQAQCAHLLARLGAPKAEARAQQARLGGLEDKAHELAPGRGALALLDEGESGWLGVTIAEITSQKAKELKLPAERGVLLTEVEADSPAAKAGLKPNDVITEFNGQRVEGTVQFRRLVRETPPDRTVQLTLWRDGRAQNVSVQLGSRRERIEKRFRVFPPHDFDFDFDIQIPEIIGGYFGWGAPLLGVSVEDLTGQLGAYFGVPDGEGVLIREVKPGSPAEKAGLKPGDVIIKLDAQRVKTASELRAKLREKREQKSVSLAVIRKGVEMSLNVEIEPAKRGQPGEHRRITRRVLL